MNPSTSITSEDRQAPAAEAHPSSHSGGQVPDLVQTQESKGLGHFIAIGEWMWGKGQTPAEALKMAREVCNVSADEVSDASAPYWHILLVPQDSWITDIGTLRWTGEEDDPRLIDVLDITGRSLPLSKALNWIHLVPSKCGPKREEGTGGEGAEPIGHAGTT
ncbi:hypothetical protein [Belnapia rosea]|uniref:hypothetical protein n=1 Tax=Belnapia rosea TaxID=938405 RepID=UPI00115F7F3A|nr:hypothetical protein [Belnapia rosea]